MTNLGVSEMRYGLEVRFFVDFSRLMSATIPLLDSEAVEVFGIAQSSRRLTTGFLARSKRSERLPARKRCNTGRLDDVPPSSLIILVRVTQLKHTNVALHFKSATQCTYSRCCVLLQEKHYNSADFFFHSIIHIGLRKFHYRKTVVKRSAIMLLKQLEMRKNECLIAQQ